MSSSRILLQPFPVPLKRKWKAAGDPAGREKPPSAQQPGLPGRKSYFFNRRHSIVVKYLPVDHRVLPKIAAHPRISK